MISRSLGLFLVMLGLAACHSGPRAERARVREIRDHSITAGPDVLILVDGVRWPHDSVARLYPDRIDEVRILRDSVSLRELDAMAYRAVILVTTKAGSHKEH